MTLSEELHSDKTDDGAIEKCKKRCGRFLS
ncbi:MAG: hypothetical protein V7631_710 [Massilia sp.]|jgi:hypothetical protein